MTLRYLQPKQKLYGFTLPNSDPLRTDQAATVLDVCGQSIHNLVFAEELAGMNIAPGSQIASWRIARASLVDFIERRTTGPLDEIDFQALEAPHSLALPDGRLLRVSQVAGFMHCSGQHVIDLIQTLDLSATNVGLSESGRATYRIPRAGLIHFINTRTEGAL